MKKVILFCQFAILCVSTPGMSQVRQTENLIFVVLDGMRWQEVFGGVDSVLMNSSQFTHDKGRIKRKFWDADPEVSRKKIFPFIWGEVAGKGQLLGNRRYGNQVDVSNPFKFTYPGFSEMLTGYADPAINSNRLVVSKSDNVLEFIIRTKGYEGKVSVFATSDLFPFLLNREKSKLYINSDTDTLTFSSPEFQLLNHMQRLTVKPTTERPDLLTYFAARSYLKTFHPRVMYLALGETDAYAHGGQYDQYIETAHAEDGMIADLWNLVQSIPQYRNKTTLILTCDHGRGDQVKAEWTGHGTKIADSGQIWIAALGPEIRSEGEVRKEQQWYQAQIAATVASALGLDYKPGTHKAMEAIPMFAK